MLHHHTSAQPSTIHHGISIVNLRFLPAGNATVSVQSKKHPSESLPQYDKSIPIRGRHKPSVNVP
jgi:hypothetical protein